MKKIIYLLGVFTLFSCTNEDNYIEDKTDVEVATRSNNNHIEIYQITSDVYMGSPAVRITFYEDVHDTGSYSEIYYRESTDSEGDDKDDYRWNSFKSRYECLGRIQDGNFSHEYYSPFGLSNANSYDFRFISDGYPKDTIYYRGFIYTEKIPIMSQPGQYAEKRPVTVFVEVHGMNYSIPDVTVDIFMSDNSIDPTVCAQQGLEYSYSEHLILTREHSSTTVSHSLYCNPDAFYGTDAGQVKVEVNSHQARPIMTKYFSINPDFYTRNINAVFYLY